MTQKTPKRFSPFRRLAAQVLSGCILLMGMSLAAKQGTDFFVTADQRGQRLMDHQQYQQAAATFADPYRQAVALYRAGDFKQAATWFGGLPSAEASFGQGNSLVMLGKYQDAVSRYDHALEMRPGWDAATANREIALGRAKRMDFEGGDMTGGELGADGITFDKGKPQGDQTETVDGGEEPGDEALRAMWLRQVQTTPGDFLRAKFAYQSAMANEGGSDE